MHVNVLTNERKRCTFNLMTLKYCWQCIQIPLLVLYGGIGAVLNNILGWYTICCHQNNSIAQFNIFTHILAIISLVLLLYRLRLMHWTKYGLRWDLILFPPDPQHTHVPANYTASACLLHKKSNYVSTHTPHTIYVYIQYIIKCIL